MTGALADRRELLTGVLEGCSRGYSKEYSPGTLGGALGGVSRDASVLEGVLGGVLNSCSEGYSVDTRGVLRESCGGGLYDGVLTGLHATESVRKLNSSALVVSKAVPFSFRLGVNPTK